MTLSIGSLFSGIGGLELGLEWAGLGPVVWQCEVDPFCRAVLAKHWPNVERFPDVKAVRRFPYADLVCGGFPCQDVSSAGKRRGLGGERSGLWYWFARHVREIRPRFVVVENVASGASRWLRPIRHQLHLLGYRTRALGIAAADVGAPHLRRRVFVVAYADRAGLRDQQGQGRDAAAGCGAPLADADLSRPPERGIEPARDERTPAQRSRVSGDSWSVEPDVGRVALGVPHRVDRLASLGNAVVPQCAQIVGEVIQQMLGGPR